MLYFRCLGQAELLDSEGRPIPALLAQPKRLALLAYLAAARRPGFHRRDTLLALFWPDHDQERARAALRQSLYTLRQALGQDAIVTRGDGEVGLNWEVFACDVVHFRNALSADPSAAADLYTGDLLAGFYVADAPGFERWLEEERWQLRREAAAAAWRVAESVRERDIDTAAQWAARAAGLDPFNEAAVRRLMMLLAESGHRAHALQIYQNFERLLAHELETAPSEETRQLAASLRVPPARAAERVQQEYHIGALPRLRRARGLVPLAVAGLIIAAIGVYRIVAADDPPAIIAVGAIAGDAAVRDMLATSLARIEGVAVISNTRLLELARGRFDAVALARAAQAAGASRILEGTVRQDEAGAWRLSLQWVSLSDGRARPAVQVAERDVFALIDAATAAIARSLGLDGPAIHFANVTSRSLDAQRAYEEGLRALYAGERTTAQRLLTRAVEEDSTFALALWQLSRLQDHDHSLTRRALHHAQRASDRERLFITASFLSQMDDPRAAAVAETLAVRYPSEPDGPLLLGYSLMWAGRPLQAIPHFRAIVRMDSASLFDEAALRCRACDAMGEIATALALADSGAALMRHAREWIRLQPERREAWGQLAYALEMHGRYTQAIAARTRANMFPPANHADLNNAETLMRSGNFAAADAMLLGRMRDADAPTRVDALYKLALSYRNQRRYSDALRATEEIRRLTTDPNPIYSALPQAYVLYDMGRFEAAALLFDSIANHAFTPLSGARNARARVNALARSAAAYAAAGDTVRLAQLLVTMRSLSAHTAFAPARDQHHFVHGLLLSARGQHHEAAAAMRASLTMPVNVPTRMHVHLARELMMIGRPEEAARVLGSALRSTVGGAGYGVTHRELHEMAADAWTRAGVPDSAAAHAAWRRRARW